MMYSKHLKSAFLSLIFLTLFSTNLMAQNTASWYGKNHHNKRTASGELFNMYGMTAAHRTIKFGTRVKVTNTRNNKSVIVRITDRGPFVKGRIIDLSYAAAKEIGISGTGPVKIDIVD